MWFFYVQDLWLGVRLIKHPRGICPPSCCGFEHLAAHGYSWVNALRRKKMTHNEREILEHENRVFKSLQMAIDLMDGSHLEAQEAYVLLNLLSDEYQTCRTALRSTLL
jgi:hypothetical protein